MFYNYEIKSNGNEEILYLYLNMSYEFSNELGIINNDKDITRRTKNFIKNNNIKYNGSKVYLVVNDIIVKTINLNNNNVDIEILNDKLFYSNDLYLVTLKMEDDSFIEITLREYLLGCIANNIVPNLHIEVLKSLCVLFRTYAYKQMTDKKFINVSNAFVQYKDISYYKLLWLQDYEKNIDLINSAIDDTDCIFITYNNDYILPFFHISNNGSTMNNKGYNYIKKVSSLWDYASPYYIDIKDISYDLLRIKFNCKIEDVRNMIIKNDENNNIMIIINNIIYNIDTIRVMFNLKSKDIVLILNNNGIRFITFGYGDFYGLSLFGGCELAKSGCDYLNILNYYFNDIKFNKYVKELSS